ncbi:DUF4236 domain-containing protein [Sedimentitalea sp. JM2-8]|uniref:DUF4236 domain-containing protein n=1 Tax=Sedimentitalea xiamensis TaxID=3050037 RepID=A0ABT7FKC4_9RHOB|nr:DUF4236 domain-containing protein [Sedimentitalea xiamensis]MDK3075537.1 DUF4236 domain-containing protein [Sedimentitalea xiamensis]
MTLRFRQTFTLFPGVRINIGKRGISSSIGVPGASVNIGRQGVRATVGAPGTGLSYSTLVLPTGKQSRTQPSQPVPDPDGFTPPPSVSPAAGNNPASAKVYMPQTGMNEIASASVEVLSSKSLIPLRDLIAKAREQQSQVKTDLREAREEEAKQHGELNRRKLSLFRWFYKKRIAELEAALPVTQAEVKRLVNWEDNTSIAVEFEAGDEAQRAYSSMIRAFDTLKQSSKIWDVTADRSTNQFVERTLANRSIDRHPVTFEFSSTDLIQFSGRAMRFENVNGDDILIYPGVAVVPRADGIFALIDIRELKIDIGAVRFHEDEEVPGDAKVIGHTWARTNKDGSPDRRFRENYQIPICLYGQIAFQSQTGVSEEYMVSNGEVALAFVEAAQTYQKALSETNTL